MENGTLVTKKEENDIQIVWEDETDIPSGEEIPLKIELRQEERGCIANHELLQARCGETRVAECKTKG